MRFLGKGLALILLMWLLAAVVQADQRGLDYPHSSATGTGCNSCHYYITASPSWLNYVPGDSDDTYCNKWCWSCHNNIIAPRMDTHSSNTTSTRYGSWSVECRVCHWPHHQQQLRAYKPDSYVVSGVSSEVTATTLKKNNAGWIVDAYKDMILIPDTSTTGNRYSYQYKITGNTNDTITVESSIDVLVRVANKDFAVIYGKLIKSTITTPNSGNKTVKFFRPTGTNSFADGGATRDGICEVCHTKTSHYRNDGTGSQQSHEDLGGKNGSNCMETCHPHSNGFKHGGAGAGCGTNSTCHGTRQSHPAHVAANGNVSKDCDACHAVTKPNFKSGTESNGIDGIQLAETDICDDCHHDGTFVATGVKVLVAPPAWESGNIGCNGCHANGPSYANRSPKANSHTIHAGFTCNKCHNGTTSTSTTITGKVNHINNAYNLQGGGGVSFSYTFDADGSTCANISCHGNTNAAWGGTACLGCHGVFQGNRGAITSQFSAGSHHIQGIDIENRHCYQCHWEAKSDGSINSNYHGGYSHPGQAVNLVIYGTGTRPTSYTESATGIAYTPNGSRSEIVKINSHCLGCHNTQNNDTEPFGDCNTPRQYAWDRNSIAARYSQSGTTSWGKYSTVNYPNLAPKSLTKAYSAHGNATLNQGGWSPSTGLDSAIVNSRAGSQIVACFDCHNSHGSTASGTTSSYASFNGTPTGAILKDTTALKGGYAVTYKPQTKTDTGDKNPYATGAGLCFDCHASANAVNTPWGYSQTYGATQPIMGYRDGIRFGEGRSAAGQRYNYRTAKSMAGGHLMASTTLVKLSGTATGGSTTTLQDSAMTWTGDQWLNYYLHMQSGANSGVIRKIIANNENTLTVEEFSNDVLAGATYKIVPYAHAINGLCTPCHDPHGISPSLGSNQAYGVPLLKGTWLTSPYKEDSPNTWTSTGNGGASGSHEAVQQRHWNTDRVTFNTDGNINDIDGAITETDDKFAGLCLRCHLKIRLTTSETNPKPTWKTVDRIHETVKGWGVNTEHKFPCAKCHVPHNSGLPRLMQTNCLNWNHRGNVASGGQPSSRYGSGGRGYGFMPGVHWNRNSQVTFACHEAAAAGGGGGPFTGGNDWPNVELWNNVTPW